MNTVETGQLFDILQTAKTVSCGLQWRELYVGWHHLHMTSLAPSWHTGRAILTGCSLKTQIKELSLVIIMCVSLYLWIWRWTVAWSFPFLRKKPPPLVFNGLGQALSAVALGHCFPCCCSLCLNIILPPFAAHDMLMFGYVERKLPILSENNFGQNSQIGE